jgi:hypothetical protein
VRALETPSAMILIRSMLFARAKGDRGAPGLGDAVGAGGGGGDWLAPSHAAESEANLAEDSESERSRLRLVEVLMTSCGPLDTEREGELAGLVGTFCSAVCCAAADFGVDCDAAVEDVSTVLAPSLCTF